MKRRDKNGLSSEDEALWLHVARTVTRVELRRQVNRPVQVETELHAPGKQESSSTAPRMLANWSTHPKSLLEVRSPVRLPGPGTIEPRKARRVAKGHDEIEARIDLHGMRQSEAHGALRGFLVRAHQNGLRMVLVITGKGRADDHDRHAPFDLFQDRDRGVLRRNVPRWLAEPELRAIVVGHTSASARHGGDGAFYVQLRNREKFRG